MVEYHDILWDIGYAKTWEEATLNLDELYKNAPPIEVREMIVVFYATAAEYMFAHAYHVFIFDLFFSLGLFCLERFTSHG